MKQEIIEIFEEVFAKFEQEQKRTWLDFLKGIIFIGNRGFNTKQPEPSYQDFKDWFEEFKNLDTL